MFPQNLIIVNPVIELLLSVPSILSAIGLKALVQLRKTPSKTPREIIKLEVRLIVKCILSGHDIDSVGKENEDN